MGLKFPAEWRFEGIGLEVPIDAFNELIGVVDRLANGSSDPHEVYEIFKSAYGNHSVSSSASWAETDMGNAMRSVRGNAALFVDYLWSGIEEAKRRKVPVPSHATVNKILHKHGVPLEIQPPELLLTQGDIMTVAPGADRGFSEGSPTYVRHNVLGKGGFGIVYRVTRQTSVGEFDFAMKVLDPSPFIENRERALSRFKREIEALRKLQHRGIVQHIEAGLDFEQKPYILMPLISGATLRDALSGASVADVLRTFQEILFAVQYAHSQNVIHRDLKPQNVLVRDSDFQPMIVDFGCAYLIDDSSPAVLTTSFVGTSAYVPSEVLRNPKLKKPSQDVFACGVMLYEVLGQGLPDPDDIKPLSELGIECEGLDDLIGDALAPAAKRISSAEEMRSRLEAIALACEE